MHNKLLGYVQKTTFDPTLMMLRYMDSAALNYLRGLHNNSSLQATTQEHAESAWFDLKSRKWEECVGRSDWNLETRRGMWWKFALGAYRTYQQPQWSHELAIPECSSFCHRMTAPACWHNLGPCWKQINWLIAKTRHHWVLHFDPIMNFQSQV